MFAAVIVFAAACSAAPGATPRATPAATASPAPQPSATGLQLLVGMSSGGYLVDQAGMSLYTFDNDTGNTSSCYDQCAQNWPPLVSPNNAEVTGGTGVTGTLATAQRTDGSGFQVGYNGDPLYYYAADSAPGETKGDGVGGVWHLAGLTSSASPSAAPASTSQTSSKPSSGAGDCSGYYCDDY